MVFKDYVNLYNVAKQIIFIVKFALKAVIICVTVAIFAS
jgi:hypothetical protein